MGLALSVLMLGLMASLSPATILVFILLLSTARALVNGVAFLVGWIISLTVVFFFSYLVNSSNTSRNAGGRFAVALLELLLGIGLVALGVHQWRRRNRPRNEAGVSNELAGRLTRLNPWGAGALGVAKQPWALTATAAVVVVRHHSPPVTALVAYIIFSVVSTATVALMLAYFARQPGEAAAQLAVLKVRVVNTGPFLLAIASLAVGAILVVDGARGLGGA
jgi:hypothetical protein